MWLFLHNIELCCFGIFFTPLPEYLIYPMTTMRKSLVSSSLLLLGHCRGTSINYVVALDGSSSSTKLAVNCFLTAVKQRKSTLRIRVLSSGSVLFRPGTVTARENFDPVAYSLERRDSSSSICPFLCVHLGSLLKKSMIKDPWGQGRE